MIFFGHLLASSIPDPHSILSANTYPVIFEVVRQQIIEEIGLLLALERHQACRILLAPLAGLNPFPARSGAGGVGPGLYSSIVAQVCDEMYGQ